MVTEFFDELMEEVIADCESELEELASIRNFAVNLCQEAESSSDVSVHSDQTQENIPTQLNLQSIPGSILDESTLTDPAESSELTNEEESSLLR